MLVDLPPSVTSIAEGSHSSGITPKGKPPGPSPSGGLQGLTNYTQWFEGHPDMGGQYAGYDGPAPPWNDERVHGYRFTLYALDVPTLGLSGSFTGQQLREAIQGHVLEQAELLGIYAIYPNARL